MNLFSGHNETMEIEVGSWAAQSFVSEHYIVHEESEELQKSKRKRQFVVFREENPSLVNLCAARELWIESFSFVLES